MTALVSPQGTRVEVDGDLAARLARKGWKLTGGRDQSSSGEGPRGNASRDEWAAYADSLGIEVAEDAKRDDIKARVEAAKATND